MAYISLIATPILVIIYTKTRELFFSQVQGAREENGALTDFYTTTLHSLKHIKNMATEDYQQEISAKHNQKMKRLCLKYAFTGTVINNCVQIVTQINQLIVLIYGAIHIKSGNMSIGNIVAFYSYLEFIYQPLVSIIQTLNEINGAAASIERYLEFYNNVDEEDMQSGNVFSSCHQQIVFDHVCFSYDGNAVLTDINIKINSGEKVLLSGRSGIGKTTMVSLIKRFYNCTSGKITLDGMDIYDYNLSDIRRNILYITQDDYFLSGTIRENFTQINPALTDDEIITALQRAQIYTELTQSGKFGIDTPLKKNAISFSGGQKRRISLAQLFTSTASIIILDEPFVGLDEGTRTRLWSEMTYYMREKTVIIIDHNFPYPEYFDKHFELDENHCIKEI